MMFFQFEIEGDTPVKAKADSFKLYLNAQGEKTTNLSSCQMVFPMNGSQRSVFRRVRYERDLPIKISCYDDNDDEQPVGVYTLANDAAIVDLAENLHITARKAKYKPKGGPQAFRTRESDDDDDDDGDDEDQRGDSFGLYIPKDKILEANKPLPESDFAETILSGEAGPLSDFGFGSSVIACVESSPTIGGRIVSHWKLERDIATHDGSPSIRDIGVKVLYSTILAAARSQTWGNSKVTTAEDRAQLLIVDRQDDNWVEITRHDQLVVHGYEVEWNAHGARERLFGTALGSEQWMPEDEAFLRFAGQEERDSD